MNLKPLNITYKQSYTSIYDNVKYRDLEHRLQLWSTRGENALRYLAKAHQKIKALENSMNSEHQELLALRMFYLSTKLASSIASDNQEGFEKAMQHVLHAENKIIEIQNRQSESGSDGILTSSSDSTSGISSK